MTDNRNQEKRPHGQTGDTVQQAAEVSKPTSPMGNAMHHGTPPQDPKPGELKRENTGSRQ